MSGDPTDRWQPATFHVALPEGARKRAGFTYRGLGLHIAKTASPKGRRPTKWTVTHLGSGHAVVAINAPFERACAIAAEIAEAGDWSFDGLQGWKNQFPDAKERTREIVAAHDPAAAYFQGAGGSSEDVARAVADARAA